MAWTNIASRGTANSKTASATLSMSPSANIVAGRIAIVWFAWDSVDNPAFPRGFERWMCADSQDNIWSTIVCGSETDVGTSSAAGIFISHLRTTIATTDTITVTCQDANQLAKAMSVEEFSVAAGMTWANADKHNFLITVAADPDAMSVSGMDSQEYLLLHVLGAEGPNTDAYTWDSDYTQIAGNGTTGGADDSNMHLRGGYRIATLTSDTVNVTSDTADRDYAQGIAAVCEVAIPEAFPTTPILDNFNRADENPLDNGTWDTSSCVPTTANKGRLVTNVAAGQSGAHGGQWWNETFVSNDMEVYASVPTASTIHEGGIGLVLQGVGCGNLATRAGYEVRWKPSVSGTSAYPDDVIDFGTAGNISAVQFAYIRTWRPFVSGNKLGWQRLGPVDYLWIDEGSGWELAGAAYDHGGLGSGRLGFEIFEGTTRMDDFGGGAHVAPFIPQIIRRL